MFESILKLIEQYDSIVINGHFNPDGDCYGSQIGLKETLQLTYPKKRIYAVGSGLPRFFDLFGKMDEVSDDVFANSLAIILDGNDLSRMEDKRIYSAKAFAKIDHHIDLHTFKQGPEVIDDISSSTSELIIDFIKEANLKIDSKCANALYLGMLTDSGRLQFADDYSKLYNHAAYLCEHGADPKLLLDILNVTDEVTFKIRTLFYSKYQKSKEGVLYVILRHDDFKEYEYSSLQIANMVNLLGNVEGYPIWACFAESNDGRVKVEIRSKGPIVQPLMVKHSGGGHRYAAGCTLAKYNEALIKDIVKDLDKLIIDYRKEN